MLHGRIQIKPFGKGTDGVLLVDLEGRRWVLSYRAEGILAQLEGQDVEVHGRECTKQFESVSGPHFDLESLRVLPGQAQDGGAAR